jgi:hypothetical protein
MLPVYQRLERVAARFQPVATDWRKTNSVLEMIDDDLLTRAAEGLGNPASELSDEALDALAVQSGLRLVGTVGTSPSEVALVDEEQ